MMSTLKKQVPLCNFSLPLRLVAGIGGCLFCLVFCAAEVRGAEDPDGPRPIIHYGEDYVVLDQQDDSPLDQLVPLSSAYRLPIFLNFDGETLHQGNDNAKNNKTSLVMVPTVEYPALNWQSFGGKDKALPQVLEELQLLYMDFAVEFVTTRPTEGDYTMAMIGGHGENCAGGMDAVGIAPLDCRNGRKNDIVLIFGGLLSGSPKQLAYVIAHELGHSFGLEHVADESSIMYPSQACSTCQWTKSTLAEPSSCDRTEQDDHQVLMDNLGPGPGDTITPAVWFLHPGEGAILPATFSIEVIAADDLRVHHVEFFLDEQKIADLSQAPFAASLNSIADGEHVLRAEVFDWKPNQSVAELKIIVDGQCTKEGTCSGGKSGLGSSCQDNTQCMTGKCAIKEGTGVCVDACNPENPVCSQETSCEESQATWLCTASSGWTLMEDTEPEDGNGGGCRIMGPVNCSTTVFAVLACCGLLAARGSIRRKRRCTRASDAGRWP